MAERGLALPTVARSQATWSEIHICDMASGKLVEHWVVQDKLGMLQQLGFAGALSTGNAGPV